MNPSVEDLARLRCERMLIFVTEEDYLTVAGLQLRIIMRSWKGVDGRELLNLSRMKRETTASICLISMVTRLRKWGISLFYFSNKTSSISNKILLSLFCLMVTRLRKWVIGFLGFFKSRTKPDRTETGRFDSVLILKKKPIWLFFIGKNRTEPKIITPTKIGVADKPLRKVW